MLMLFVALALFALCPTLMYFGLQLAIVSLMDGRSMKRNRLFVMAQAVYLAAIVAPVLGILALASWLTLTVAC